MTPRKIPLVYTELGHETNNSYNEFVHNISGTSLDIVSVVLRLTVPDGDETHPVWDDVVNTAPSVLL